MLLALRTIVDADLPIPVRIGVNRGAIFAGDIGPFYRRTYTVMGDAVNLSARLMAKAEPGHIYATADVLDRSNTLFATTAARSRSRSRARRSPFAPGRSAARRARGRGRHRCRPPAADRPRSGAWQCCARRLPPRARATGSLIDIVGEAGIGKIAPARGAARRGGGLPRRCTPCARPTRSIDAVRRLARASARVDGLRPRRSR